MFLKLKQRLIGAVGVILLALLIYGGQTLWGFRNDYLQVRAEAKAAYGYIAQAIAKDPQTGKVIVRADLLEQILKERFTEKKE